MVPKVLWWDHRGATGYSAMVSSYWLTQALLSWIAWDCARAWTVQDGGTQVSSPKTLHDSRWWWLGKPNFELPQQGTITIGQDDGRKFENQCKPWWHWPWWKRELCKPVSLGGSGEHSGAGRGEEFGGTGGNSCFRIPTSVLLYRLLAGTSQCEGTWEHQVMTEASGDAHMGEDSL